MKYTLKINGKFFVRSGKVSAEYPDARQFDSYSDAHDAIELYNLLDKGHVELFFAYGTDSETVEDC